MFENGGIGEDIFQLRKCEFGVPSPFPFEQFRCTGSYLLVYGVRYQYWNVCIFVDERQVEVLNSKIFYVLLTDFMVGQSCIVDIGSVFILISAAPIPILCKLTSKTPKLNFLPLLYRPNVY